MKKIIALLIFVSLLFGNVVRAEDVMSDAEAKSLFLTEANTGRILYERNPDEELPIASVTKIMTMLLAMEAIDDGRLSEEDFVTASEHAESMGGSTMFLERGETVSVRDLLKGIAVASANDGAVALAEHLDGSEGAFVEHMNRRARELGMTHTHFVNPNGLDAEGHVSSARDVAQMSCALLSHPKIFEYTTIWTDSLREGKFQLANTNKLIRFYPGANGLKTGSTSRALCCLSATAERDGMQLIAVVLGAPNSKARFSAAKSLLDYGFSHYTYAQALRAGENVTALPVILGSKGTVSLCAARDSGLLLEKGDSGETQIRYRTAESVRAPIIAGTPAGEAELYRNDTLCDTVPLVYGEDVPKKSFSAFLHELLFLHWLG